MSLPRLLVVPSVTLAVALALTGCGAKGGDSSDAISDVPTVAATSPALATTPATTTPIKTTPATKTPAKTTPATKTTAATKTPAATKTTAASSTSSSATPTPRKPQTLPGGDGHKACEFLPASVGDTILRGAKATPANNGLQCSYTNAAGAMTPRIQLFRVTKKQILTGATKAGIKNPTAAKQFASQMNDLSKKPGTVINAVPGIGDSAYAGHDAGGVFADFTQDGDAYLLYYFFGPKHTATITVDQIIKVARSISTKAKAVKK